MHQSAGEYALVFPLQLFKIERARRGGGRWRPKLNSCKTTNSTSTRSMGAAEADVARSAACQNSAIARRMLSQPLYRSGGCRRRRLSKRRARRARRPANTRAAQPDHRRMQDGASVQGGYILPSHAKFRTMRPAATGTVTGPLSGYPSLTPPQFRQEKQPQSRNRRSISGTAKCDMRACSNTRTLRAQPERSERNAP
jgi:hypothetical protein